MAVIANWTGSGLSKTRVITTREWEAPRMGTPTVTKAMPHGTGTPATTSGALQT